MVTGGEAFGNDYFVRVIISRLLGALTNEINILIGEILQSYLAPSSI